MRRISPYGIRSRSTLSRCNCSPMMRAITAYDRTPHDLVERQYTLLNAGNHPARSDKHFRVLRCFRVDDELPCSRNLFGYLHRIVLCLSLSKASLCLENRRPSHQQDIAKYLGLMLSHSPLRYARVCVDCDIIHSPKVLWDLTVPLHAYIILATYHGALIFEPHV